MPINSRTKHRDTYKRYYENEDKDRRFVHDPFTLDNDKVKVSCDKDGKITLQSDNEDDTFDEIIVPASLIFKIAMMLEMTRSIQYLPKKEGSNV